MPKKTLLLLRHAHRDKDAGHDVDNGLSQKGRRQAKRLTERYLADLGGVFVPGDIKIYSSPKKRCIETVEGISDATGVSIEIQPLLDEGERLKARARSFVEIWKRSRKPLTIACSHGDWLPVMLLELTGTEIQLSKAGWAELVTDEDWPSGVRLTRVIQKSED